MDKCCSWGWLKAEVYLAPGEGRPLLSQRNNTGILFRVTKRLKGNETGVTLIETLVALAILGLIAVAFLSGLTTAAQATFIADQRATAESLARSQMEYVKNLPYDISYPDPGEYDGYSATIGVESLPDTDGDIQKITVTISRGGVDILTVEDYKVDR